ncbi:hypothetical protein C8R43DRAFT_615416 [Mycena crocata]|nr:hypothetical protein C8R43DRAFT_615416 [Mycena crocata]
MSDFVRPKYVSDVPQVPLQFFFRSILPPVAEMVFQVEGLLAKDGHLVDGQWVCLPSGSKVQRKAGIDSIASLIQTFDAIVTAAESVYGRAPSGRLVDSVAHRGATTQSSDAEIRLLAPGFGTGTSFVTAVPLKLKTMRAPRDSNNQELIWSCQDVLRDDPCRRFTFGITLEDGDLRMWFFSRSDELVSSSFNIAEVSAVIQVFLALAFATPEQLGYDTTMSHIIDDCRTPQLKITVENTVYITKKLLSDQRAAAVCSRTTRVWEAYREDDPDRTSVAVKDLWTSSEAIQEGAQLLELHEKLQSLADPGTPRPPEDYFLTVLHHGYVHTSEGVDDHTLDVMTRSSSPPTGIPHYPRKHYRIVFKEVGVSVYDLQTLSEVMSALADATRALRLLHELGFVHRDVSPGNILVVNGIGKLSDLESVQPFRGPSVSPQLSESYVGTANFTAGEAAAATYSYVYETYKPIGGSSCHNRPRFRFNPFHDIESTLWIGIWVVLYHRRSQQEFKQLFKELFPSQFSRLTVEDRRIAISCGFLSLDEVDPFSSTLDILHTVRVRLFKLYATFEGDLASQPMFFDEDAPLRGSAFDEIHAICIAEYEKAASQSEGILLAELLVDTKRKALCEARHVVSKELVLKVPPERPLKKQKINEANGPAATRFSETRKRRGQNIPPTGLSSHLAQRSKKSKKS